MKHLMVDLFILKILAMLIFRIQILLRMRHQKIIKVLEEQFIINAYKILLVLILLLAILLSKITQQPIKEEL